MFIWCTMTCYVRGQTGWKSRRFFLRFFYFLFLCWGSVPFRDKATTTDFGRVLGLGGGGVWVRVGYAINTTDNTSRYSNERKRGQ